MFEMKNTLVRLFSNKKVTAIFALSMVVIVAFQNCAKIQFEEGLDQSKPLGVIMCEAPVVACQTDRGSGTRTCTDTETGPVYGSCVLDQCIPPYTLVAGQCLQGCQPPGSTRSCPNVSNGSGTQVCDANGNWGMCNMSCNAGFYLNVAANLCLPEYFNFNVIGYKGPTDATWMSMTPSANFQARAGYQYRFQVDASPNFEVLGVESGLEVTDIGNPVRISQCSSKANSMWNPMEPWGMEGPCSNLATCPTVKAGANDWNYNTATAEMMGGCGWLGEISARRIGDMSTFRKVARITVDALLCEPGMVIPDPMCPTGNKICSADGRSAVCVAVTTTTVPPTTTTIPPTTTTVTLPPTTTTIPPTTTTITLPPTTTTLPPTTTTMPPVLNCTFNGQTIANGANVTGYQAATVPFGQQCQQQSRVCNNGTLSGSYAFASCAVTPAATCSFNGQTVAHGANVTGYQTASVAFGQQCQQQSRTCNNGTLSGSYAFSACSVAPAAACMFNNRSLAHGGNVTAYQSANVPFGQQCQQESRVCTNGNLSGSFMNAACSVQAAATCTFNGQTVAHGANVTAYQAGTVPFGQQCQQQSRVCTNGSLSGSYTNSTCSVGPAATCSFNGQSVAHGANVTAYQASSVPFGQSCQQQSRACTNGNLSGSFMSASCSVQPAATCSFNGQNIAHGGNVTAYQSGSVPYGQSCVQESRVCTNGSLNGSYASSSCTVAPPASCSFNGQNVAHGASVTGYAAATVPYGQVCAAGQTRTCNNGTLSGSYAHSSCSVSGPANCPANGGVPTNTKCDVREICADGRHVRSYRSQTNGIPGTPGVITQVLAHNQVGYITASGIVHSAPYTTTRWDNLKVRCENGNYVQLAEGWCGVNKVVSCEGGGSTGGGGGGGGSTGGREVQELQ